MAGQPIIILALLDIRREGVSVASGVLGMYVTKAGTYAQMQVPMHRDSD